MRGCIIQVEKVAPVWVDFRYEHFPIFCYRCGLPGHSVSDCFIGRGNSRNSVFDRDQYGSWLRALLGRYTQGGRRPVDGEMGTEPSDGHEGESEQSGGLEQGTASFHEVTSSVNNGNHIPQNTKASLIEVEVTKEENGIIHVPFSMDCQRFTSLGGRVGADKDMKMSKTEVHLKAG